MQSYTQFGMHDIPKDRLGNDIEGSGLSGVTLHRVEYDQSPWATNEL